MSANNAVTVLRSPSSAAESATVCSGATRTPATNPGGDEVAAAVPAPLASGAPHLPQKSDVGGFSALHFAHCLASAFPHFAQKLFIEGLFVPRLEQRIDAPRGPRDRPLSYHPTSSTAKAQIDARSWRLAACVSAA